MRRLSAGIPITHPPLFTTARVAGSSGEEHFDPKIPPEKQIVTYQTKDGTLKKVTKAELQEQMETREKLMNELNETWEQKLQRTQEVQKEREKALEELGITVEKNLVGVHTPKKVRTQNQKEMNTSVLMNSVVQMPHLVNLVCVPFCEWGYDQLLMNCLGSCRMKVRHSRCA